MLAFYTPNISALQASQAYSILTPSQQKAFMKLLAFALAKENYSKIRLNGYAGTGKTFLLAQLTKFLVTNAHLNVCIASPTNEAKRNALGMLEDIDCDHIVTVCTLAQLLGLQPVINDENGVLEFKKAVKKIDKIEPNSFELLIIDESSMINEGDYKLIMETIYKPVIFVGDSDQIPPINEQKSKVYLNNDFEDVFLTEIVRYDGEIAYVAETIRKNPLYRQQIYPFKTSNDGTIQVVNSSEFLHLAVEQFTSSAYRENFSHCAIACWRNITVDDWNELVRESIWGYDCAPFVVGDRLITRQPVMREVMGKDRPEMLFANSERLEVVGDFELTIYDGLTYFSVPVEVWGEDLNGILRVITPESREELNKRLETIKAKALLYKQQYPRVKNPHWRDYYRLRDFFDNVAFSYARTTHKLQGSSINHLFFNARDYRGCSDIKQSLQYTALTRAKKDVTILL